MPATQKNKKIKKSVRRKKSRVVRATLLFVFVPKNKEQASSRPIERKYLENPADRVSLLESFFKKPEKSYVTKQARKRKDEL